MGRSIANGWLGSVLAALLVACGGGDSRSALLSFTPNSIPPPTGTTGVPYPTFMFVPPNGGLGGPFTWTESGALPPGMSLSPDGRLSGTPIHPGTFFFTLTVTNSSSPHQVAMESVTLVIKDSPVVIAAGSPSAGIVNYPYPAYPGFRFSASGGTPPYSWKITSGSPPPGLAVLTDGSVSGTPTTIGTFSFSVTATDSWQQPMASRLETEITVGPGPVFTLLHSFAGSPTDGSMPFASLVLLQGDLYGTASGGSVSAGVVFKLGPNGEETVLHNFAGSPTDGAGPSPYAPLISDASGNLYGTTGGGGASDGGVVFKVDPAGKESVLYNFTGGPDGGNPAGLVQDAAGNLYGTTTAGGAYGQGVVFKLDPTGKETVLYTFTGGADGAGPYATLVRDDAGNLYGITSRGGSFSSGGRSFGVVFKVNSTGTETVLHEFTGGADGSLPVGLIQDSAGNLYGTTAYGGDLSTGGSLHPGCGVVFKLDPTGKATVLYTFNGYTDGCEPLAVLVRDAAGNLYGTTETSGACQLCGVVFKLDMSGKLTVLYTFTGSDGLDGRVGLIRDANGALYGETVQGGASGQGVVFRLIP